MAKKAPRKSAAARRRALKIRDLSRILRDTDTCERITVVRVGAGEWRVKAKTAKARKTRKR